MKTPFLIFLVSNFFITTYGQGVIYVDSSATGLNNGKSWTNAYNSLDSVCAIPDSLFIYDSLLIAKGTYKPGIKPKKSISTDVRDVSFHLPAFYKILGGYPGGGGVRNAKSNPVILSGDIGIAGNNADNAYHVVIVSNNDISIDGLIIESGNANGTDSLLVDNRKLSRSCGGGIAIVSSSTFITNSIVRKIHH